MFSVVPGYPMRDLCDTLGHREKSSQHELTEVPELPVLDAASEPALAFAIIPDSILFS